MIYFSDFSAPSGGGEPVYTNYSYTGAAQSEVVPSGVSSVTVWLVGGAGGNGNFSAQCGSGGGGFVEATFPVTAGQTLKVEVGGGGAGAARNANGGLGGWPDGGDGGRGDSGSGGGGGSTRFYIDNVLMAVAGGGGGAGGYNVEAGAGGGATGESGSTNGGTGGSQVAGGVDSSDTGNANKTGRSIVSFPGVQRTGGFGSSNGDRTITSTDDGGGGGGGYYGGGGGGGDSHGGGGGSGWVHASATASSNLVGARKRPATVPVGAPSAGAGKQSGVNGAAISGGNGAATIFRGTPYQRNTKTGSTSYARGADEINVSPITFASSVKLKTLLIDLLASNGGNAKGVIYSDAAGLPDTLLFTSAEIAVGATDSGFMQFDLAGTELAAGTYWFGLHGQNASTLLTGTGSNRFKTGHSYAGGPPSSFGTGGGTSAAIKMTVVYY